MIEILHDFIFGTGQHQMAIAPLAIAAVAAGGFIKSGGLEGILGSGKRKQEEREAAANQKRRQREYENFDYNQDVGYIHDPYAKAAQDQAEFDQENIDRAAAQQLGAAQQAGQFGATQALIGQATDAARKSSRQTAAIQQQGAQFVESQRQSRISDRYDQAETFLGRADNRLAQAKEARKRAKQKIFEGIGGGLTAAAGAVAGGGGVGGSGFEGLGKGLSDGGIIPQGLTGGAKNPSAGFDQFLGGEANTNLGGINQNHLLGVQNATGLGNNQKPALKDTLTLSQVNLTNTEVHSNGK